MMRLVVVGGGKMGEAIAAGLLSRGWASPTELAITELSADRRRELEAPDGVGGRYPGLKVAADLVEAEGAVLAVKPGDIATVCKQVGSSPIRRVLSVAAGIPLADLESWLRSDQEVVRAMPNTPALVGCGAAGMAAGSTCSPETSSWAQGILESVGIAVAVAEPLLDAVTGLSGSGPAYVFLVAEALIEAGVLAGLPRPVSQTLAIQTLLGSAQLLATSGLGPEVLRAQVTSPGGTTAAGLRALEARAVRSAFLEAVQSAAERSTQLGH